MQCIYQRLTFIALLLLVSHVAQAALPTDKLTMPPGFKIEVYAADIANARQMALSPETGIVYVGTRASGHLYAVIPSADKKRAAKVITLADNLRMPNGVAYRDGHLYVAEYDRILRFDNIDQHLQKLPRPKIINDSFPSDGRRDHSWKYIAFSPDGDLYVPVGAPCNICHEKDTRYASIMHMKADGSDLRVFANGVRNSVGFDFHPVDKTLWFTDNGRDWLGDDSPPDELNHAPREGMHFGFPFKHGADIFDPSFGHLSKGQTITPPVQALGPHVAALGMRFYTGKQFPARFQNQILIAEHGSWNRSKKSGYRVTLVTLKHGEAVSYEPFISGWLQDEVVWGRPVDIIQLPDGSILVSDDYANAIYRVSFQ